MVHQGPVYDHPLLKYFKVDKDIPLYGYPISAYFRLLAEHIDRKVWPARLKDSGLKLLLQAQDDIFRALKEDYEENQRQNELHKKLLSNY